MLLVAIQQNQPRPIAASASAEVTAAVDHDKETAGWSQCNG